MKCKVIFGKKNARDISRNMQRKDKNDELYQFVAAVVFQCVYFLFWKTHRELDDLVKHDIRRDVEIKDKVLH